MSSVQASRGPRNPLSCGIMVPCRRARAGVERELGTGETTGFDFEYDGILFRKGKRFWKTNLVRCVGASSSPHHGRQVCLLLAGRQSGRTDKTGRGRGCHTIPSAHSRQYPSRLRLRTRASHYAQVRSRLAAWLAPGRHRFAGRFLVPRPGHHCDQLPPGIAWHHLVHGSCDPAEAGAPSADSRGVEKVLPRGRQEAVSGGCSRSRRCSDCNTGTSQRSARRPLSLAGTQR